MFLTHRVLEYQFISGIDLIAGNKGSELQPLVLGNSLVNAMKDQNKLITDLNGIVFSLINAYLSLVAALAAHVHVSAPLVGGTIIAIARLGSSLYISIKQCCSFDGRFKCSPD